ncbi:MAG: hypothetical protein MJ252_26725 [archaeon]|nr:hypothetical protein [archaeon]
MKFLALLVLFAAVFAHDVAKQDNDVVEAIKCVLDKCDVILPEVVELCEAIRNKDYLKVISLCAKLYEEGKGVYDDCFKDVPELNFNWPAFGKCLLDNGASEIAELAEVVVASKSYYFFILLLLSHCQRLGQSS